MAGTKTAPAGEASAHAGHDMGGTKKPEATSNEASPHAGHDMPGMKKPESTSDQASAHAGHDTAGMKPKSTEDKASPHADHDMGGMKKPGDKSDALDAEEHLKGVVSKKSSRSVYVTLEDSSTVEVVTTVQTQFERGDAKADLTGVKTGERIVVYASRKDGRWVARVVKLSTGSPEAAKYTCPMHPEVRSAAPGSCPRCGMKLVPVKAQ